MSQRDKFKYAAFGLTAGIGIALLLLVWAVPGFRNPAYQQETQLVANQQVGGEESGEGKQIPEWRYWTERLIVLEDTAANWLMAFFAIVATGVSVWAVKLLRDTLDATRKAVEEAQAANRIMAADQRPWITFNRHLPCDLFVSDERGGCEWVHERANVGRQPAFDVFQHQKLVRYENVFKLFEDFEAFVEHCKSHRWRGSVLLPGNEPEQPIQSFCGATFMEEGTKYALMAGVSYRHSGKREIGVDARLFDIERDRRFPIGPRAYMLIEFPHVRVVE